MKTGYELSIYYPDQPLSQPKTAPAYVAGSHLKTVITIKVFDAFLDVRFLSLFFQGTKRTWTYVGIDKTFKTLIIRDNRMLINFIPGQECTRLNRGIHTFPVDMYIPEQCPSVIEKCPADQPYLKIRYKLRYTLDVVDGVDQNIKHYPLIYNASDVYPKVNEGPPSANVTQSPLGAGGPITLRASINKSGYAQWEDILLTLDLNNQSSKKIKSFEVRLTMIATEGSSKPQYSIINTWNKGLYPFSFPRSEISNTIAIPLSDIRKLLPQSFVNDKVSISYQITVVADVPGARDVSVVLPIRILVSVSNTRQSSRQLVDPLSLIPKGNPSNWRIFDVAQWIKSKLLFPQFSALFENFGISGSDLLMISPQSFEQFVGSVICDDVTKQAFLSQLFYLYRQYTLPRRLLNALSLGTYIQNFEKDEILADDMYMLTEADIRSIQIPLGPTKRIFASIRRLESLGPNAENTLLQTGYLNGL
jgi:hypothetical protein